jgi:hypothetical protein
MRGLSHRVDDNQEPITELEFKFFSESKFRNSKQSTSPQKQNTEGFLLRCFGKSSRCLCLEGEPHASTEIADIPGASVEVTSINEDADMISEAIFKTSADIAVAGAVHVPSATAAD